MTLPFIPPGALTLTTFATGDTILPDDFKVWVYTNAGPASVDLGIPVENNDFYVSNQSASAAQLDLTSVNLINGQPTFTLSSTERAHMLWDSVNMTWYAI